MGQHRTQMRDDLMRRLAQSMRDMSEMSVLAEELGYELVADGICDAGLLLVSLHKSLERGRVHHAPQRGQTTIYDAFG